MGSIMGKAMDKNMEKNQEFMLNMNKMTIERQIQMQNQMRERMVAFQIAKAREMFYWLASFYVISSFGMISGFRKSKSPTAIAPLLPLTFLVAYQGDLAYGSKMDRIRFEAENIMNFEKDLLLLPCNLPTMNSIEQGRYNQLNNAKPEIHNVD